MTLGLLAVGTIWVVASSVAGFTGACLFCEVLGMIWK